LCSKNDSEWRLSSLLMNTSNISLNIIYVLYYVLSSSKTIKIVRFQNEYADNFTDFVSQFLDCFEKTTSFLLHEKIFRDETKQNKKTHRFKISINRSARDSKMFKTYIFTRISSDVTKCSKIELTIENIRTELDTTIVRLDYRTKENEIRTEFVLRYPMFC